MKAEKILEFAISGWVAPENMGVCSIEKGRTYSDYFFGLCDDLETDDGKFFWFWVDNDSYYGALTKIRQICGWKCADIELPTKDGWYVLMKIDD